MSSMYPSFGGAPARPCIRCGNPLTGSETQCSRCGTYNAPPQGQQFGMFQQQGAQGQGGGPSPSGQLWGGQAQQASPYQNGAWPGNQDASASAWGSRGQGDGWQPNTNNLFGGQNSSMQQNSFGSGFSGSGQSSFSNFQQNGNESSFNNTFGGGSSFQQNANQSAFGNSFGMQQNAERPSMNSFFQATRQNGYGGTSTMAPERPSWAKKPGRDDDDEDDGKGKNRPSAGVIIVIVILAIALIGGGGFGGYYILKHRNPTPSTTNTGPTIATPTGTPEFSDFFKDNKNGWDTNAPSGTKITLAGDGKLLLESDDGKLFPELVPGGKTFSDLRVDVDAGLTGGDTANGYGVYIRTASTQNATLALYYRFEVYGDGSFWIYKGYVDGNGQPKYTALKQSGPNNAVAHAGSTNHLTIEAKGQTLTFIVNGTTVSTFTDPNYKSGGVALFVSQVQGATTGAQAVFKNFAIFAM